MRYHEDGCNVHPVNYAEGVKLFFAAAFCRRSMPEGRQGEDCIAWHGAPLLRRPRLKMLCRFPFPIPFVCAGPEGENGYAPTGRHCVDCRKITLLLRRIGKWDGRQFRHLAVARRFRRKDVSHPLGRTQNAEYYITSLPWRNVSNFTIELIDTVKFIQ